MRTPTATPARKPRSTLKHEDRLLSETWSDIARNEGAVLKAATRVIETVPAPADMIDSAIAFATRTLRAQREALVPLLEGVTPKLTSDRSIPTAADAVSSAYDLAERVLETQRKVLRGLIETVTPPLARHAEEAKGASRTPKRAAVSRTARPVTARKTPKGRQG
jgi:hypothetical protein